ncbi:DNA repair protein RadC [Oceanotoga sp. DSM 15011]|uniref:DNA replication and repair protein RadC n=1 Tax=Oceanotoga teriensis TaxID=515440 RepID=A0AA45C7C5_9BACT|nr:MULTISPECIES: DNA repair protein RadC [Oceanotoga]MDO7976723.1 DNA repair protein RadC [Oceanotoga teriensis]PWJ95244.1 DNA replication and repair protein RadC [Oceanotoga teriensis]UYP00630.1 DNA repair protein RadC [Oceanotoga sp. DSM 15011]
MNTELLPREKLLSYGSERLTDQELIAIILRRGVKGANVFEVSKKIIEKYENFIQLYDISIEELQKIKGVGQVSAINLKASLEMGKRYHIQKMRYKSKKMESPLNVYNYCEDLIHSDKEIVRVLILDSKLNLIIHEDVSIGTANASIAHPRDIFKKAIIHNAVSIILVHNHPSGDPRPSMQDYDLTEKVKQSGEILGIKLQDHIIIGKNKYYSFNISRMVELDDR